MSEQNFLPRYPHAQVANEIGIRSGPPINRSTSGFAVAALVLSIVGGVLLSIIFGVIALTRTGAGGQRGRGMAVAALVISALWIAVIGTAIVVDVLNSAERDEAGEIIESGHVSADSLRVGDCLVDVEVGRMVEQTAVSCAELHDAEVFGIYELAIDTYPGEEQLLVTISHDCSEILADHSPAAYEDPVVQIFADYPTEERWPDDRTVVCIGLVPDRGLEGKLADWPSSGASL